MIRTIADKLLAKVIEVSDLDSLFPSPALKGRIGLDIRIERGSITPNKTVRLSCPAADQDVEIEIVGVEMLANVHDPNVVRILCSKPKELAIPTGKVEGWSITE
jgi:hypothetical protein